MNNPFFFAHHNSTKVVYLVIKSKNKYISFDLSLHKTLSDFNKISLEQKLL